MVTSDLTSRHSTLFEHFDRDRGVVALMRTRQAQRQCGLRSGSERCGFDDRRAGVLRDVQDDGSGIRRQRPDDHRHAGLDDAGFLKRDLAQGVAEMTLVVERDGGDRRDCRVNHIRRVEASAQADFHHRHRHTFAPKHLESDGGGGFKERGRMLEQPLSRAGDR